MSAYVVDTSTVDRIVLAMKPAGSHAERTRLGRDLLALNVQAVQALYGTTKARPLLNESDVYTASFARLAKLAACDLEALKACRCFLYQCADSSAVVATLLYQAVSALAELLAARLAVAFGVDSIEETELYDRADGWC